MNRQLLAWLALVVAVSIVPRPAGGQIAPTGVHYAGRPSDTGHIGPSASGSYSATIPLELPAARGDLPLPLQIISGAKGFGAAGVGWDIPLSYVLVDRSFVHRRPAMLPGAPPTPRERITVSLLGQQAEMIRTGGAWASRHSNTLAMRRDGQSWIVTDGGGRSYTFTQHVLLAGTGGPFAGGGGLWLLDTIRGNGGTLVKLQYDIQSVVYTTPGVPGTSIPAVPHPVLTIDLVGLSYNLHPSDGCFKHDVSLRYAANASGALPQALSIVGARVIARLHALQSIVVTSRASCSTAPEVLRKYSLEYAVDPDTQQQRLATVSVSGRQGTPEETVKLPVASYRYGTATRETTTGSRVLRYVRTPFTPVMLTPGNEPRLARTERVPSSSFQPPAGGATSAASVRSLTDFTGDGIPDLVLGENGAGLTIRRGLGGSSFGPPAPLTDNVFTRPLLDVRASDVGRFVDESSVGVHYEFVWTQSIDVNGDGRIDVIDAAAEPNRWVVYLNTPDSGPSGIKWVRRSWDITRLNSVFTQHGIAISSQYLPLGFRVTGRDHRIWKCWQRQSDGSYITLNPNQCGPATSTPPTKPQQTYVVFEVRDINGDGYPDVVFNSATITWNVTSPVSGPTPATGNHEEGWEIYSLGPVAAPGGTRILAALNVRGALLTTATDPFSAPFQLTGSVCGVGLWSGLGEGEGQGEEVGDLVQVARCGFLDANGDGLVDRFENGALWLGTGFGFDTVRLPLPAGGAGGLSRRSFAVQQSAFATRCGQAGSLTSSARQHIGLRDLTGDGIPDLVDRRPENTLSAPRLRVFIGTGAGFTPTPVNIVGVPDSVGGPNPDVTFSTVDERCDGTFSNTTSGLFDVTGDGRPDFLKFGAGMLVYQLDSGGAPGAPEAGRLVEVSNGYGGTTRISYGSAKQDTTMRHQVPAPEIVVTSIQTTGDKGFGGTLAATRYAYGDIELFYDSILDIFRTAGYRRRVELMDVPALRGRVTQNATIVDTYPLDQVTPNTLPFLTDAQQFGRYLRAGRPRDVTQLAGNLGFNARALLALDVTSDPRRVGTTHYSIDTHETRLFVEPGTLSDDCKDVMFPYDFALSSANNSVGYDHCTARGFLITSSMQSWRGSAGPPSDANVQSGVTVRSVDDFGRTTSVLYLNDLFRSDDDVCVDVTYAAAMSFDRPQLDAIALRRVGECGKENATLAEEAFEYDHLFPGLVLAGHPTRHLVFRHDADTGAYLSSIRTFDANYDTAGNPAEIIRTKPGATQVTRVSYDPFGLVPANAEVSGTAVATLAATWITDPISDHVIGMKDANGTIRGRTFDGFGRPLLDTIAAPGSGISGVLASRAYLNDAPGAVEERGVRLTEFTDAVAPASVMTTRGRVTTTRFDELGRLRSTRVELGSDYADEVLIVGARTYDPLGRVAFEADPYPASEATATAYGTTRHFAADGSLALEIRGAGPQPYSTTPSAADERFPTVFRRAYANHEEISTVQSADALTPGSPQFGVVRQSTSSGIGQNLSRSTWRNGTRLEHMRLGYDGLGHLTRLVRYQDPASPSGPVGSAWRFDSIGRLLALYEPGSAPQLRSYSDWGELEYATWVPPWPEPARSIVVGYDALGRVVSTAEQTGGIIDPMRVAKYQYDTPATTSLMTPTFLAGRLASATSAASTVALSYDGFGNIDGRSFTDQSNTQYLERHGFHADGREAWIELRLPDNGLTPERVEYAFDSAGEVKAMRFATGGNTTDLYTVNRRDSWGRIRNASYGQFQLDADYADTGRRLPRSVKLTSPQAARFVVYDAFDAMGRETGRDENLPTSAGHDIRAYDPLGRLETTRRTVSGTTSGQWAFNYDALGNVTRLDDQFGLASTKLSYLPTNPDGICAIAYSGVPGGCNVEHDGFGSIVKERTPTGYNKLEFFHSGDVRRIENEAGAIATFQYDAFGTLADLTIARGTTVQRHERRIGAFIAERTWKTSQASSQFVARTFAGPGVAVTRRGAAGPWIYEFAESRGIRFTTDGTSKFVQDISYTPFGQANSSGVPPGSLAYTSDQWNDGDALDDFGLVRLGARVYDPRLGRFLSRDPLLVPRSAATTNPYAFALNDPVNMSDPSGRDPCAYMNCVWASSGGDPVSSGTIGALATIGVWAIDLIASGQSRTPPDPQSRILGSGSLAVAALNLGQDQLFANRIEAGLMNLRDRPLKDANWILFAAAHPVVGSAGLGRLLIAYSVVSAPDEGSALFAALAFASSFVGAAEPEIHLNVGAGSNPMKNAVNLDIRAGAGIDVVADVNAMPFNGGLFSEVHAINPYGFYPATAEVARVLKPGGLLRVTGTPGNKFARPLSPESARAAGFEVVETTPMIEAHNFGIQRFTSGEALSTAKSTTTTYRRLP